MRHAADRFIDRIIFLGAFRTLQLLLNPLRIGQSVNEIMATADLDAELSARALYQEAAEFLSQCREGLSEPGFVQVAHERRGRSCRLSRNPDLISINRTLA